MANSERGAAMLSMFDTNATALVTTIVCLATAFVLVSLIGLERHHHPVREIETLSESDELVELAALLAPTTANPKDLDAITEHLGRSQNVESATWTVSTTS
jgi:hypothetical protein